MKAWEDYTADCLRTESRVNQATALNVYLLWSVLRLAALTGKIANLVKRDIFYGKPSSKETYDSLIAAVQFQLSYIQEACHPNAALASKEFAITTNCLTPIDLRVLHASLGIFTEAAEVAEASAKAMENQKMTSIARMNFLEELGDLFWYVALMVHAFSFTLQDILNRNILKLKARHGDKFNSEFVAGTKKEIDALTDKPKLSVMTNIKQLFRKDGI